MSYTIIFSEEAVQDIKRLDTVVKKRLQKKLQAVAESKDVHQISKKLIHHESGQYRIRIGNFRIIFDLDGNLLYILRVRHRKEVYR